MKHSLIDNGIAIILVLPVSKFGFTQWFSYDRKFKYYRNKKAGIGFDDVYYNFNYFSDMSVRCQIKGGSKVQFIKRKVVEKI